eukprot:TRINITY_DN33387_c0_g1_i1.p2 TRINITY_DN33387_c0_g1~~TRINITY_DN33387_c0_g1_i1.p2  ORF type:complete len:160 (+),score=41.49 TRINITY_DN33387_c0_g1_i1:60-539(+)
MCIRDRVSTQSTWGRRVLLDVRNSESVVLPPGSPGYNFANGHADLETLNQKRPAKEKRNNNQSRGANGNNAKRKKDSRVKAKVDQQHDNDLHDFDDMAQATDSVLLQDAEAMRNFDTSDLSGDDPCTELDEELDDFKDCLLYTSPSPRDGLLSRMPSSA